MGDLFFFASKLIWFAIMPSSLIAALLVLAAFCVFLNWRRLAALFGLPPIALLATLAIYPVNDFLMAPLEHSYPPSPDVGQVAGIIVLGGGEDTAMTLAWDHPQMIHAGNRFLTTMRLAQAHPDAAVLLSGGNGTRAEGLPSGAEIGQSILSAGGVAPDRMILEDRSDNTDENARFSLPLRPITDGNWLLVTSAFHMRRSVEVFCAAGWTNIVPYPSDFKSGRLALGARGDMARSLRDLNIAVKEYIGIIAYRWTGRASEPGPHCLASL